MSVEVAKCLGRATKAIFAKEDIFATLKTYIACKHAKEEILVRLFAEAAKFHADFLTTTAEWLGFIVMIAGVVYLSAIIRRHTNFLLLVAVAIVLIARVLMQE